MAQNAQNKTDEQNEKSAKDLATENARLKLTATRENLADLRNKYDKGVVRLSIFCISFQWEYSQNKTQNMENLNKFPSLIAEPL